MAVNKKMGKHSQGANDNLMPWTPTIGTATDVGTSRAYNNGAATVTFTAKATGGTPTSYTATSTPGSYTGTASSSPITVTGLTGYMYANGASNITASTTIPTTSLSGTISNAQLANSTISGVALGGNLFNLPK